MSRFGTKKVSNIKTNNLAGGESYKQSSELELCSLLLTSFTKDKFYRSSNEEIDKLKQLLKVVDSEFACKAAVYTRHIAGMRSISHVLTAEIAPYISGKPYARSFYNAVVRRPDDMLEILSYGKSTNWVYKTLPKAMQRGFRDALNKFDSYQLAKWRKQSNDINLVNIIHLTHPKPTKVITDLYKNRLKNKITRESVLSNTGQIKNKELLSFDEIKEIKTEKLQEGWKELISTKRIGYKALVGSLVKIINEAPEMVEQCCEILRDYNLIKKSLIMPSELIVAFEEVIKLNNFKSRVVLQSLEIALNYSVENAPKFNGQTLVVLDESGSMTMNDGKPARIGALFSAVLCKKNNCDLMTFSTNARYRSYNPMDSVGTITNSLTFSGGGTNFHSIFQKANKSYDRIIILSDMQGWVGHYSPNNTFNLYCKTYMTNPYIYSFDLAGYGTTEFPSNKIITVAGFSNSIFDLMKNAEESENILLEKIKSVNFNDYSGKNKN